MYTEVHHARKPLPKETPEEWAKVEATLRRLCKRKPRGGLAVPESIHKLWLKGGKARRELHKVLVECQGNKDRTHMHEHSW